MGTIAYLTVVGARQGPIKGNVTAAGREGTIALTAVSSQLDTPFDPATGAITGRRQHHPLTVTKLVDQATPKLYQALVTNERLTDVTIAFWEPAPHGGGDKEYFTIKLTNASVVGIAFAAQDGQGSAASAPADYQEVQLTYEKIVWTWVDGSISAGDDWAALRAS